MNAKQTDPDDYPYVRAWGRTMGSYSYYIDSQVERARRDDAPANALYVDGDGRWHTTDEIWLASTRERLGLDPLPPREPDPAEVFTVLVDAARHSERLHDLYGLTEVTRPTVTHMRLRFATGQVADVDLRLATDPAPTPDAAPPPPPGSASESVVGAADGSGR